MLTNTIKIKLATPINVNSIISLEVHKDRDTYKNKIRIRYYDENNKVKIYETIKKVDFDDTLNFYSATDVEWMIEE